MLCRLDLDCTTHLAGHVLSLPPSVLTAQALGASPQKTGYGSYRAIRSLRLLISALLLLDLVLIEQILMLSMLISNNIFDIRFIVTININP
jgi:hypothetical protein